MSHCEPSRVIRQEDDNSSTGMSRKGWRGKRKRTAEASLRLETGFTRINLAHVLLCAYVGRRKQLGYSGMSVLLEVRPGSVA